MDTTSLLRSELQEILKKSEWPLCFDEIFTQISAGTKDGLLIRQVFSPYYGYRDGQRLFHPAESIQKWFRVEVVDINKIKAIFDDGSKMLLAQNASRRNRLIGELSIERPTVEVLMQNLLNTMEDVIRIGSFYLHQIHLEHLPLDRMESKAALEEYLFCRKERNKSNVCENKLFLETMCGKLRFKSFCYITSIHNLSPILKHGILCKNLAPEGHESFANEDIQEHRHQIVPNPSLSLMLHDYVPLFFTSKPPLLYRLKENNPNYVKIHISPEVLLEPGVVFHDMNARSPKRRSFTDFHCLPELNWNIIHADFWTEGVDENQRHLNSLRRQAEADIPLKVITDFIKGIVVHNAEALAHANKIVSENKLTIPVICGPDQYFN